MARVTRAQLVREEQRYEALLRANAELRSCIDRKNQQVKDLGDHVDSLKVWCGLSGIAFVLSTFALVLRRFL